MTDKPKEKILVESSEVTPDILSTQVNKRENGIDDAMLYANDEAGKQYLATLHISDEVEIQYQWADDPDPIWVTVFKGNIVELSPNLSKAGEIVSVQAYGKGACFKNCRIATEYGAQSYNSGVGTVGLVLYYLIHDWVNKLLNDTLLDGNGDPIPSGNNLTFQNAFDDDAHAIDYILFKYQDTFSAIQDVMKLAGSARYVDNPEDWSGIHWIVDTEGRFMYAPIGNHEAFGVSTYWVTRPLLTPIVVKSDMINVGFVEETFNANIVAVSGRYLYPANELWTEDHIELWKEYDIGNPPWGTVTDDDSFAICGTHSVKLMMAGSAWFKGISAITPVTENLNMNLSNLNNRDSPPTINFMIAKKALGGSLHNGYVRIRLGSTAFENADYWELDITSRLGPDLEWTEISLEVGDYRKEGWIQHGLGNWNQIDWIQFVLNTPDVNGDTPTIWIDKLEILGSVIRIAYDSTHIIANGAKMITIKDSLASTDNLDPDDSLNPLARVALGELLRQRINVLTGSIVISLNPVLKAGQIVHVHASGYADRVILQFGSGGYVGCGVGDIGKNVWAGNTIGILTSYNNDARTWTVQGTHSLSIPNNTICMVELGTGYGTTSQQCDSETGFGIDKDMRIVSLTHTFAISGAVTILNLSDDLFNSVPRTNASSDAFNMIISAVNPDFQSRTLASLKTGGDFDPTVTVIAKDYPS